MVGRLECIECRAPLRDQLDRGGIRPCRLGHAGADRLVVVIGSERRRPRPDERGDDPSERAESALDLADVVKDRPGDLGPGGVGTGLTKRRATAALWRRS